MKLAPRTDCWLDTTCVWLSQTGGSGATALPVNLAALNAQERQELIALRRKLRQVQMERAILAKAMAWFAGKSEKTITAYMNP